MGAMHYALCTQWASQSCVPINTKSPHLFPPFTKEALGLFIIAQKWGHPHIHQGVHKQDTVYPRRGISPTSKRIKH